jgi:hypothetical protein
VAFIGNGMFLRERKRQPACTRRPGHDASMDCEAHWNRVCETKPPNTVSWHEAEPGEVPAPTPQPTAIARTGVSAGIPRARRTG